MFYYFGRKSRLAKFYPTPKHALVIEPFAGSMAYTLYHRPEQAIGTEIDNNVWAVWHAICKLSKEEILNYHEPSIGDRVSDRWSMMAAGSHGTAKAISYLWTDRMLRDLRKQKRMAARNVDYARTIDYRLDSYENLPDVEATWFIDPPYQRVHRGYQRDGLDYAKLAQWCMSRKGLVIVCEQDGADWLPFESLTIIKGTTNKITREVVWTNQAVPCTSDTSGADRS